MTTVDLELEIGRNGGDGYPVLARSGNEVATTRLTVTSVEPDRQLAMLRSTVLTSSTEAGPEVDKDQQHMRELGTELFETLFAGDVRELYAAGRRRADEQDSPMRLVLRVHPPELARLPWEFLFDPARRDYLGLSLSLVRYPELLAPRQPLRTTGPLRVLGMVIGADQDSGQAEQERQRLHEALAGLERDGLVELGWVDGSTAGDLEAALDRGPWHSFHAVSIEGQDGGGDVSRLLADHDTMRIVVLDAHGTGPGTDSEGFAGMADALLRQGTAAVVAMQFAVTEAASIAFAQPFYLSVAGGLPVDVGVMRARRAVRLANKDTLEWGTPVLYLRASDGQIFQAATASGQAEGSTSTSRPDPRYAQALDAFWAQQWDQAIALLEEFLDDHPDHPDAVTRLTEARHEQELAGRYAQACAAADAADWESAIAGFAVVAEADPINLEARDRLEQACREQAASESALPAAPRLARYPRAGQILHSGKEVNAVAFSPDGQWLATAGRKNIAQVWDTTNGQEMLSVGSKAWRRSMEAVEFSPDGQWLATAGDDGTARIWDATSGEELLTVTHEAEMWGVAFSPDGRRLATVGDDGTARIWDATSGEELLTVTHDNWVRGVAFSPDGCWLATACVDRAARIWDVADGEESVTVTHDSLITAVAFSPDGEWLATAGDDGTARIWDATIGLESVCVTHNAPVTGVVFSPDSSWLATASQDGTARVWDVTSGQELATVRHADLVWAVAFSPDGSWLATGSADKTARLWPLLSEPEEAASAQGTDEAASAEGTADRGEVGDAQMGADEGL